MEFAVHLRLHQRSFPLSTALVPAEQGSINGVFLCFFFSLTDAEQSMIHNAGTRSYSDEKCKLSITYVPKYVRHLQYVFNSFPADTLNLCYTGLNECKKNDNRLVHGVLLAIAKPAERTQLHDKMYKNDFLLFI